MDDSGLTCSGPKVGKVIQTNRTVKVRITNGTPSTTRQVFEVSQSGLPCHGSIVFTNLGTITTDGTGFARKKFTRVRADPVHYDICPGTPFSCTGGPYFSGIFSDGGAAAAGEAVEGGDPSSP